MIDTELNQTTGTKIITNLCPNCNNHIAKSKAIAPNDYIIKTNKINDLSFDKQFQSSEINNKTYVFIKLTDSYQKIIFNTILYIKSEKNYLTLKTSEKEYRFRSTLKDFISKLPDNFIQTHKSFIINTSKIENFNNDSITLTDNMKITVSVSCRKDVLAKLKHQLL